MKKIIHARLKIEQNQIFIGVGVNYNFLVVFLNFLSNHFMEFVYSVLLGGVIISATNFAVGNYRGLNLIILTLYVSVIYWMHTVVKKNDKKKVSAKKWDEVYSH